MRRYPFDPVTVRPELTWRLMREEDRATLVEAIRESEIFGDPDGRLDSWWRSPVTWPLVLDWRGRILQFEGLHFPRHGDPVRVIGGFIRHLSGERPHWFWRECEAEIWRRLAAVGCQRLFGHVRADRPDWAERLKTLYGGVEVGGGVNGSAIRIEYSPERALQACTGWPARRTAAIPDVHELTLVEAQPMIEAAWGDRPRKAEALRIADEWWSLDSATLLEVAGHVRVVRQRQGPEARLAVLTPLDVQNRDVQLAVRAWCRAAGYERIALIIPAAQIRASAATRAEMARPTVRVVQEINDGDLVEVIDELVDP